MKIDQRVKDSFFRVFLRSIPLLPAPELYDVLLSLRKSQSEVDQQVNEAVESLRSTSTLVSTLQNGIEERIKQLQVLREEHAKYSELAQIEAKKAEPLLRAVEAALGKEQRKERWIAFAMHIGTGLIYFVLGVVASDPLKRFLDHVWSVLH